MWIGTGRFECMIAHVDQCPPSHALQDHLTCVLNVKKITILMLELIHQVEGFAVSVGGDWDRTGWC